MGRTDPAQAATRLLLQQPRLSLRFDITGLHFDRPITFDTLQNFCATTNASMQQFGHQDLRDAVTLGRQVRGRMRYVILTNETATHPCRRRFTLAHEIGHIYLQHIDDGCLQEDEADAFAAQLLLPQILVGQLREIWGPALTAGELAEIFAVSLSVAERSLRRLRGDTAWTEDDYALLQRSAGLLPDPDKPLISL